jgi:hypothetical protein
MTDRLDWTNPTQEKPPLDTQVLIALKECAGGKGEVLDVAVYLGKRVEDGVTVERWIGTGNRFETRQIAGWMTVRTMSEINKLYKELECRS